MLHHIPASLGALYVCHIHYHSLHDQVHMPMLPVVHHVLVRISPNRLLHISRRQSLHHTRAFTKPRPEDAVGVLEHAVLQTDDDEL